MPSETTYTLTISQDTPPIEEIAAKLAEIADDTPTAHPEHNSNTELWIETLEGTEPFNWHDMEKDMAKVSLHWPGVLFTVECKGETAEDLWRVYAKDGMYQIARADVTYPGQDPEKMKRP